MRMRFLFEKRGWAAFIRHVEVPQLLGRMARRAGLDVEQTQGFSPHPHIVMGPALPVGVLGLREVSEMFLSCPLGGEEFVAAMNAVAPAGFRLLEAVEVGEGPGLGKLITAARYLIAPRESSKLETMAESCSAVFGADMPSLEVKEGWLALTLLNPSSLGLGHLVRHMVAQGSLEGWPQVKAVRLDLGLWRDGTYQAFGCHV